MERFIEQQGSNCWKSAARLVGVLLERQKLLKATSFRLNG
jgi:hypothetical protein